MLDLGPVDVKEKEKLTQSGHKMSHNDNLQRWNLSVSMQQHTPNTESLSWYFPSFQRLIHLCTVWIDPHGL